MYQSLLQTDFWAKFKESGGWLVAKYGELYGLTRQLPFGKSLLYFPEIPLNDRFPYAFKRIFDQEPNSLTSDQTNEQIGEIKGSVGGRILTRFEFLEPWSNEQATKLVELGLVKAFEDVQPEYRQWLDLNKSENELLEEMKPKGRYNIGVAKKHDLKVVWGINDQSVKVLFELYQQTAQRADFQGRNLGYFQKLAKILVENKAGDIVIVSKDNLPLSALLLSFYDGVCSYLYGGSGVRQPADRSLMAPYLAHWEAIHRAKQEGCVRYDLLAIAPFQPTAVSNVASARSSPKIRSQLSAQSEEPIADSRLLIASDSSHPHAGLTRFKTQFGGQSVRLLGSWDLVHSRYWYMIYRFIERRRRKTTR